MADQSSREPAIRGTLFSGAIEEIDSLLADGTVCRDELEVRLDPADLSYIG